LRFAVSLSEPKSTQPLALQANAITPSFLVLQTFQWVIDTLSATIAVDPVQRKTRICEPEVR